MGNKMFSSLGKMSSDDRRRQKFEAEKGEVQLRMRELELEKRQLETQFEKKKLELEKRAFELEKRQFHMKMEQKEEEQVTSTAIQMVKVEKSAEIERQAPIGRGEVEKTPTAERVKKRALELEKHRSQLRELEQIERDAAVIQVQKVKETDKIERKRPTGQDGVEQAPAGRPKKSKESPLATSSPVSSSAKEKKRKKNKADRTCRMCKREFRCPSALKVHAFTHGTREEKPFACEHRNCRFRCVQPSDLKIHEVCHLANREGKFVCQYCDSAKFARGIALANHLAGCH